MLTTAFGLVPASCLFRSPAAGLEEQGTQLLRMVGLMSVSHLLPQIAPALRRPAALPLYGTAAEAAGSDWIDKACFISFQSQG